MRLLGFSDSWVSATIAAAEVAGVSLRRLGGFELRAMKAGG